MFFNEKITDVKFDPELGFDWKKRDEVERKFNLVWDTRGDPLFMDLINERIVGRTFDTKQQLTKFFKDVYFELTGQEMTLEGLAYCKKFVKGWGISDGHISGIWLRKGGAIDTIAKYYGLKDDAVNNDDN